MGTVKKILLLLVVLSLGFQVQAQRCGACIIKGDLKICYKGTDQKRFEMNSVPTRPALDSLKAKRLEASTTWASLSCPMATSTPSPSSSSTQKARKKYST